MNDKKAVHYLPKFFEAVRARVWAFDPALAALTFGSLAFVTMVLVDGFLKEHIVVISCATAAAVLLFSHAIAWKSQGVFLSFVLRLGLLATMLIAATGALTTLVIPGKFQQQTVEEATKHRELVQLFQQQLNTAGATLSRSLDQIAVLYAELQKLRSLTEAERQTFANVSDELIEELEKTKKREEEALDRVQQAIERESLARKEAGEQIDEGEKPIDPESNQGNGLLDHSIILPPQTRELVIQTEKGRLWAAAYPILGPVLGGLLGGGKRTEVRRVVENMFEGGRIPASNDLKAMFAGTTDADALVSELNDLLDRAVEQGAITSELAEGFREEIRSAAAAKTEGVISTDGPISHGPTVDAAIQTIREMLQTGADCNTQATAPDFVSFTNAAEKARVINSISEPRLRECLEQYEP